MKKILGCIIFALVGSANAAIITSTADVALAGATIETFNSVASGDYNTLSLPGVTIVGNGSAMTVDSVWTGPYGISGQSLHNSGGTPNSFDINFTTSVSAFGIFGGAVNNAWIYTAYDSSNNVLESITTSGACCSPMFFGIANTAGISRVNLSGGGDWVIFDNLYYTANEVPEPGSLALFGLALSGLAALRGKKKSNANLLK